MTDDDRDFEGLHPTSGLRPGAWYACAHPERPPLPEVTAFDGDCPRCTLALETVRRLAGNELAMEERSRSGVEMGRGRNVGTRLAELTDRRDPHR